MGPISRWAVNRPWLAVGTWVVLLIAIFVGASQFGGKYNDSFSLPDTESSKAQELLATQFGGAVDDASATIVFAPATGSIEQATVRERTEQLATQVSGIGSVGSVVTPYQAPNAAQQGLISPNHQVGRIQVRFKAEATQVPAADIKALVADVERANSSDLAVGVGGQVIEFSEGEPPKSELVGVLVAIVIMLIMFGSIVAAGLPILTAALGVVAGIALVTISANVLDIPNFGPTLAGMIGLGVGIDYALFVINRYRQAVLVGREPKAAAIEAVSTAGRAVVFAGTTVIIALAGLFVLRMNFMNGLAIASAITVITVMCTAVTLLPAVLSLLGRRTFAWRMPWGRRMPRPSTPQAAASTPDLAQTAGDAVADLAEATPSATLPAPSAVEGGGFARYGAALQRRPWLFGAVALLVMVVLGLPMFAMRMGFPDAGGRPAGDTTRIAYDLTTRGFGAGANGPFIVVVELPNDHDLAAAQALSTAISKTPGVVFASPVVAGSPAVSESGTAAIIQVQPSTGPQDAATTALLETLRNDVIPKATAGTGATAYVGGTTATTQDFSAVLGKALPWLLLVVVGLGFVVLAVLFRSLVVPLTAAVTSLLSFGAAMGVTVFVFQWGNLAGFFGVTATGPILPFLPIMLFAILFGLSMDYQVFLVSRMQEEWARTKDNRVSVRRGLGGSGRVVAAAAAIMFSVFISFVFGDDNTIKMFGLSLAIAIALDAFVVRLVLVPSLMTLLGRANWYLPSGLRRVLPKVHIESEEEAAELPV